MQVSTASQSDQCIGNYWQLIEQVVIQHIAQRFPLQITAQVITEEVGDLGIFIIGCAGRMGTDNHIFQIPQGTLGGQWLGGKDIERRTGNLPTAQSPNYSPVPTSAVGLIRSFALDSYSRNHRKYPLGRAGCASALPRRGCACAAQCDHFCSAVCSAIRGHRAPAIVGLPGRSAPHTLAPNRM